MSALREVAESALAERFNGDWWAAAGEPRPAGGGPTYPLDLVNYDGSSTTWWFPVVNDPGDTPPAQLYRRHQLEAAAARMART